MRTGKVILVSTLALALGFGCKKKKTEEGPTTMGSGSAVAVVADAAPEPDAAEAPPAKAIVTMLPADMKWAPLDEKAGDKGPMMAAVWGDPMKEPNGMFLKLPAGSQGMWHSHTGDYHGVTISGGPNHLQDGETKAKPLLAPSYWFEPKGTSHNSQCLGKEPCVVFIQFNEGPFDFAPAESKKGAKPDPRHVEKREKDLKYAPMVPEAGDKGPMVAPVWGDAAAASGSFIKLPAGMVSPPHTHSSDYHAVIIKGTVMDYAPDDKAPKEMGPGSYYMQPGGGAHITACKAGSECLSYVYSAGKFDMALSPAADATTGAGSAAPAAGSAAHGGSAHKM
ncbi:MAG: DUF4437 domain-containing protein [Deltaproteobacteria bacterium]|nr:DUF4437 domain-containing protein [Deltaproteobacteria bacterium]